MSPWWSRQAKAGTVLGFGLALLLALGAVTAIVWPDGPPDPPSGVLAVLDAPGLLSHGDDRLPSRTGPPQATREVGWPCEGDGSGGKRVQWVYGFTGGDTTQSVRPTIEQIARQVEGIFADSSQGQLLARYVTEGDCALSILGFQFTSAGQQTFDGTINELSAAGHNRQDRKYLVVMQGGSYCGIGTVSGDAQPGAQNAANGGPSYARVDQLCRNSTTAAHELVHNLGGVQLNAPNSTGGWHCTDGLDVMCYADGAANPTQRVVCPDGRDRLDCRNDDYFGVGVPESSYLYRNWNVARSQFLASGSAPTTAPPTTVSPPTTVRPTTTTTGKGTTKTELSLPPRLVVGQDVTVTASVSGACDPTGTVAFIVSGQTVSRQVVSAGKATATLRFSRPGRFTLRATFSGSDRCATSTDSARKRVTG